MWCLIGGAIGPENLQLFGQWNGVSKGRGVSSRFGKKNNVCLQIKSFFLRKLELIEDLDINCAVY